MLRNTLISSTAINLFEIVNRVHITYTQRLPHNLMSTSIGIALNSMRATTVMFDTGSGRKIIRYSKVVLARQRHLFSDYKIFSVENVNGTLQLILSDVIKCIRIGSAFY